MRLNALTRRVSVAVTAAATALGGALFWASPAQAADNPVTPGDFTGYGFDQCLAPTQARMTAWMNSSPFLAVGIYISGASRGCPRQPNLTPTWVRTQLAAGWRLLPITLGPQASCSTRDRYLHQVRINPSSTNTYGRARAQGRAEADKTVGVSKKLGIVPGSTLWYDIEAFDSRRTACRESAMYFLQGWTNRLHQLRYVSGVYSSAASGIRMMDNARRTTPSKYDLPDRLWIADWNGKADVLSSYISDDGWMPHGRMHQYRGGHNETYGGVTINIDNNWIDLGKGSFAREEAAHCGGLRISYYTYHPLAQGTDRVVGTKVLHCLLKEKKLYSGALDGSYDAATTKAVRAYQKSHGLPVRNDWTKGAWVSLLSDGAVPVSKYGSSGDAVRRAQRALNATGYARLRISGVITGPTVAAIKTYQGRNGFSRLGVLSPVTWQSLNRGRY